MATKNENVIDEVLVVYSRLQEMKVTPLDAAENGDNTSAIHALGLLRKQERRQERFRNPEEV